MAWLIKFTAVSVYGPQIFELLGFGTTTAEDLTQANYISYFVFMTLAWLLIDAVGRRSLMVVGSAVLTTSFALLALFGGLAMNRNTVNIPMLAPAIPGTVTLFVATWAFGIGWWSVTISTTLPSNQRLTVAQSLDRIPFCIWRGEVASSDMSKELPTKA